MSEYLLVLSPIHNKKYRIRKARVVIEATEEEVSSMVGEEFIGLPGYIVNGYELRG